MNVSFGRISDKIYYFSGFEDDVGAGVISTEEGLVVVDTMLLPSSAGTFLGIIRALYPRDQIVAIINTHIHADHHFGNDIFKEKFPRAEIIAHERFLETLEKWAIEMSEDISTAMPKRLMQREDEKTNYYLPYFEKIKVIPPSRTVSSDTTLRFGNTAIQILCTPGHTEDHLMVYLPEEKILFAGDSIYPTMRIPTLFMGDPDAWIESLEKVFTLDIKVLLPGHGWIPEDPYAEIKRHIETLRYVKNSVIDVIKSEEPITYHQLEKRIDFLKERNLLGVLSALVKRGIIEADSKDLSKAKLRMTCLDNLQIA